MSAPALVPVAAAAAPPSTPRCDDDAAAVVEDHLRTMERFLATGHEVMQAYLADAAPATACAAAGRGRRPRAGRGARRPAARRPGTDPWLRDHTLGRVVSRTDPALTGLPLMPLALSLEVLAEAAAALRRRRASSPACATCAPTAGSPSPSRSSSRCARGGSTPEDGAERVRVELRDRPGGTPAVEGTVLLAHGACRAARPAPAGASTASGRPARRRRSSTARPCSTARPGRRSRPSTASPPARRAARAAACCRRDPGFVLDPVVLDAAGQVIGFWAAERLERGPVVFPFRLAALDVHGPRRPEGEALACARVDRSGSAPR